MDQRRTWSASRLEVAKAMGWSESTARRALRELKQKGELQVLDPGGGAGNRAKYWVRDEPV